MTTTKSEFLDKYLTPLSVLLGAIIIAIALMFGGGSGAPAAPQEGIASAEAVAKSLGLNTRRIENLVEENRERYQAAIDADREEGESFGIQGTPGSIVGTQLIPGAYPLQVVLDAINGEPLPEIEGAPPAPENVDIANVKLDTSPAIGSPGAPKTMAVWYDFQCSFCKRFEAEVLSELETTLVEEGQLRIVYKDFQFLGPASNEAGLYSRAVWEAYPDRWHEWFKGMLSQ